MHLQASVAYHDRLTDAARTALGHSLDSIDRKGTMSFSDLAAGATTTLAFMLLIGFLIARVGKTAPTRLAATLTALAVPLGTLPAIILAVHGR